MLECLNPSQPETHSQEFLARQAQQGQRVQQGRQEHLEVKDRLDQLEEVKGRLEDKALQAAMGEDVRARKRLLLRAGGEMLKCQSRLASQ